MILAKVLLMGIFMTVLATSSPSIKNPDTVILLHGIGHTGLYMMPIEWSLRKQGYNVLNLTYPSRRESIHALTVFLHDRLDNEGVWEKPGHVHFVTHSMGGLVTKNYLEKYRREIPQAKMGRVVMIAPPNGGSEVADFLTNFHAYRWFFGPAGQELTTINQSKTNVKPWYDLGVIAGTRSWPYVIGEFLIPGANDGLVSVDRAMMKGIKDFITVKATHGAISWRPDVNREIAKFLKNGKFDHET